MSRLLPLALLPLVALLAALVRFERGLPVGSVDEGTAAHLRRIELALLEGEAPLADSFVNPPGGAALPAPPFLDTALAAVAARLSVADGGALGLQDEERLEAGARWFGPALGALGALVVALLTLALTSGAWSGLAAFAAATSFALWPAAVDAGAAGRVDVDVVQAALAAIGAAILAKTVTARDTFDWVQGGLSGGLFAGAALLLGPAALVSVPLITAGYVLLYLREKEERSNAARRAGLLFALAAAVVTSLPAGGLGGDGAGVRWARGASALAFVCGAPFMAAGAVAPGRRAAAARLARAVGASAAVVLLPYAAVDLWPRLALATRQWALAPTTLPTWQVLAAAALGWAAAWRVRGAGGAAGWVAWAALALLPAALVVPAAGPAAAVCACAVIGLAVVSLAQSQRLAVACTVLLGLAGLTFAPTARGAGEPARSAALRCLRALERAPWDRSDARPAGSLLAPWSLGHRLAYLGRRPPTASGFGHKAQEVDLALAATDEVALAGAMRALGATHVVAGAVVEEAWSVATPYADTALARLAEAPPEAGSPLIEELRIGGPAGPELVVLALRSVDPPGRREPSLRAR